MNKFQAWGAAMTEARFTASSTYATLIIGVIGGLVPALQGALLPQLVAEGQLTLAGMGRVATAEAFGTLIAIMAANIWLRSERLRLIVAVVAMIGLLIDLATARLSGEQIMAARFVHGLCAGILLWVWVGLLTRAANPARLIAIYVTGQAAMLLALSSFFATTLLAWGGAMAGFAALAALYGLIALLAWGIPARYDPLHTEGGTIMPDRAGWIGLGVVFLQLAAVLGLWVYIKPLGQQFGLDEATIGWTVSIALGSQIVAGLAATALAERINARKLLITAGLIGALATVLLGTTQSAPVFMLATTVLAFFWLFVPPFHMPYLLEIDRGRRAAIHMATAQLLGVAAGPALASLFVTQADVRGALLLAGALYVISAIIVAVTRSGGD
jgi:MFS transporter, DHA1 family, inner membrane transport protein